MTCRKVLSVTGRDISLMRIEACKLMRKPGGEFYREVYEALLKVKGSIDWKTRGKLILTFPARQVFKFLVLSQRWKEAKRWNG